MKEFITAFTITFLLCSGILFSVGIISVRVSILIAYIVLLLSLILGLIVISHLFILQLKLQGENKMTEKELEQRAEESKKGFSVDYEYGRQNERKLQLGKTNLLHDIERLEKENEQLKKEEKAWFDLVTRVGELKKEKCELLGLIQGKDKLIKKMKCCGNCKFSPRFIVNKELCITCTKSSDKSKWELAK